MLHSGLSSVSRTAIALAALLVATGASAHDVRLPLEGNRILVKQNGTPESGAFHFVSEDDPTLLVAHDPTDASVETAIVVTGTGPDGGGTGRIDLDPALWQTITNQVGDQIKGYRYDATPSEANGGVTKVVLRDGRLKIHGSGENWSWGPAGAQESVWVHFQLEEEWYCSEFPDESASVNRAGKFRAAHAGAPGECPEAVCGNGIQEVGEGCDDGNLDDADQCDSQCRPINCDDTDYASTFAAIENVVFDAYGCTNSACHGSLADITANGLDLRGGNAYDELVNVEAKNGGIKLVVPNEPDASLLYQKLAAKTLDPNPYPNSGTPMPSNALTLSEDHLQAVYDWIRGGAPRDTVVIGTDSLLATCLPEADPLTVPWPDPPESGVQLISSAWDLPANTEDEVCYVTYFDIRDLVPDSVKVPCPDVFQYKEACEDAPEVDCTGQPEVCGGSACIPARNVQNPDSECFAFHQMDLIQDAQSHHTINFMYAGIYSPDHPGWGPYTYKRRLDQRDDSEYPHGEPCDPTDIDPTVGYNPHCSSEVKESIACIFYGPPDFSNFGGLTGGGSTAPQTVFTQEAYWENIYADGVYRIMPAVGVYAWNSHAFNWTSKDTTMSMFLNLHFAEPEDQLSRVRDIFDANQIFAQDVPPFETQELCKTFTVPEGAALFHLTSHTHRLGTNFRMWEPPNAPCQARCPETAPAGLACFEDENKPYCDDLGLPYPPVGESGGRSPFYRSTSYSDPVQFTFDPAVVHDDADVEDRTYLYCAEFDNGSTPTSPEVKRISTSPLPPFGVFGDLFAGGPCALEEAVCLDGPSKGQLCGVTDDPAASDANCDSAPGEGDGQCDACPATGGVTSEDEMFIAIGEYFFPPGN